MKNIMIIVPNLSGGGQERIAAELTKILKDRYKVYLVNFSQTSDKYDIDPNTKRIYLNIKESNSTLKKMSNVLKRCIRIRNLKRKNKIDLSISFGRSANIVNSLAKGKEKVIVSIRNTSDTEIKNRNVINTIIYERADKVLFVSKGQCLEALKYYSKIEKKCFVIYNPCDVDIIKKKSEEPVDISIGKNTIVSCGRLESVKCYYNLINSVILAKKQIEDLELLIIGEGREYQSLLSYIDQKNAKEYIKILPFTNNPFAIISKCKAFVFASRSEGFPNVICESLACGKAIISTDCLSGPREILGGDIIYGLKNNYSVENNGILTPVFSAGKNERYNEEIYARAIVRIIRDEKLRKNYEKIAVNRALEFSVDLYKEQIVKFFDALV